MSGGGSQRALNEFSDEHGTTDTIRPGTDELPHLTTVKPKGCSSTLELNKDSEYWCSVCSHRVTVGTENREYGHRRDCEHFCGVER